MTTAMPVLITAPAPTGGRVLGRLRATGVPGMLSAAVIAIAMIAAIFGPLLAPYDPNLPNLSLSFVGPTAGHVLGYDYQGRDVFSRLLAGARTSMLGPVVVVFLSIVLGSVLAVIAAWRRGTADAVISAVLDILFAFPGILLAILATAVFGPGLTAAAVALSIAYMPYVARVLRGAALREPAAVHLRARGAGGVGDLDLLPAPDPEPLAVDRRAGDGDLRIRDGRPRRDLLPRARRPAADRQLGRDGLGEPDRDRAGIPAPRARRRAHASSRSSSH